MSRPLVVVIHGLSGTGKTTLGTRLAHEISLPFLTKDGIKERLFDELGWSDRAWSRKLGEATYTLLFYFLEIELMASRSCIIESNFSPIYSPPEFQRIQQRYPFSVLQLHCVTDSPVLWQRFQQRAESGQRHPGHVEHLNYDEFRPSLLHGESEPLAIGGSYHKIDTTDFSTVDYSQILETVREELLRASTLERD